MKKQLIVGMPSSGKSTFIAAIRHLLLSETALTELKLIALSDKEDHLNELETDWLECKEVQRTKPTTEGWVEFHVQDRATHAEAILCVPDLRGETFEQPVCSGQCQTDLYEALAQSDGLVLFTNADRAEDTLMISDVEDIFCNEDVENLPETDKNFDAQKIPEEIKLIEFLQVANRRPLKRKSRRIALIISAWDVVDQKTVPNDWLKQNRPMLYQFLKYNTDLWDARIYAVSAQGGRLPRDAEKLSKIKTPSERIQIVGHKANCHDLTSPLRWLGNS